MKGKSESIQAKPVEEKREEQPPALADLRMINSPSNPSYIGEAGAFGTSALETAHFEFLRQAYLQQRILSWSLYTKYKDAKN